MLQPSLSFLTSTRSTRSRIGLPQIFLVEDDREVLFGNSEVDNDRNMSGSSVYEALNDRKKALKLGIGKRYITRTQKGFLNVHYEPSDPYDINNVVNQLKEGQIVTSTGPQRGLWIPHDAGGWSICKFHGFAWLEPIDE